MGVFLRMGFRMSMRWDVVQFRSRHGGIGVTNSPEIGQTGADIKIVEKRIVLWKGAKFSDFIFFILQIPENNGVGRAGLLAGGLESSAWNPEIGGITSTNASANFCFLDPLDAESAFFHDSAHSHGDIRILLELDRLLGSFGCERSKVKLIQGSLVVVEEVESADLVGAVVGAVSSPDTAIISHYV